MVLNKTEKIKQEKSKIEYNNKKSIIPNIKYSNNV